MPLDILYDACPRKDASFASANTGRGFVSLFGEIFDPDKLKRIYIVKGGPGTGKNALIGEVAAAARAAAATVETFMCSSDPDSLDGVIINGDTAIYDGTAPHAADPRYPGAVESVIDLGMFLDGDGLAAEREMIASLTAEKGQRFKRTFSFLKAARIINDDILSLTSKNIQNKKMSASVGRVSAKIKKSGKSVSGGTVSRRFMGSLSHLGYVGSSAYEDAAETVYTVSDLYLSAYLYMDELADALAGEDMVVFPDVLDPGLIKALFLPASRTFVTVCAGKPEPSSDPGRANINMERFVLPEYKREHSQSLRFSRKCRDAMIEGAVGELSLARAAHDRLEKIYAKYMDFAAKEEFSEKFVRSMVW